MKDGKVIIFRILSAMLIAAGLLLVYLNLVSTNEKASIASGLGVIISGLALLIMSFTVFKQKE